MPVLPATSGIVSQAFRAMEMQPIGGFGDGSEEAIAAAEQYEVALDMCLAHGEWSFASRTVTLPRVDEVSPDPDLPFVYRLPVDCVAVYRCGDPVGTRWRLEAARLYADEEPLSLRYGFRPDDESKLGATFRAAVSYRLAALLSPRWARSLNRVQTLNEQAEDFLQRAARDDRRTASLQRYDGMAPAPDWAGVAVWGGVGS